MKIEFWFTKKQSRWALLTKEYETIKESKDYINLEDLKYPIIAYGNLEITDIKAVTILKNVFKNIFNSPKNIEINENFYFLSSGKTKRSKSIVNVRPAGEEIINVLDFAKDDIASLRLGLNVFFNRLEKGYAIQLFDGMMIKKDLKNSECRLICNRQNMNLVA